MKCEAPLSYCLGGASTLHGKHVELQTCREIADGGGPETVTHLLDPGTGPQRLRTNVVHVFVVRFLVIRFSKY